MASTCVSKHACYQNVYKRSGVLQQFITKCVVGGRVMCNSNNQYHVEHIF